MRTPRPRTLAVSAVAVVVVLALGAVLGVRLLSRHDDGDRRAAEAFARAWQGGTLAQLAFDPASGADPAGQVGRTTAGLTPADQDRPQQVRVGRVLRDPRDDDAATADLDVTWQLDGAPWSYRTALAVRHAGKAWRPVLAPAVLAPGLTTGRVLRTSRDLAPRAAVLDRAGTAVVQDRPVVTVGLQPGRVPDLAATVAQVAPLVGITDTAGLLTRARAAAPTAFVEVVTLRQDAYAAVRDRLQPLPGVVFRTGTRPLAPTTAFARGLLGAVGPATAEVVQKSGGTVQADQQVGLSGLQQRFQAQLAGSPGLTVTSVAPGVAGDAPRQLYSRPAVPGTPLQLTLDSRVQEAADAALAGATLPSALVALQPSTGDVLAVANNGPDGPGYDRALTGRYPPGSTFKIASTLALLGTGLQPTDTVDCPPTATVSGKEFANAESEQLGPVPFTTDFAQSCNTAFVGSAKRVTSAQLAQAATALGYGSGDLGVGAATASVPVTTDPVQHAAQMIGQGQVLATPLDVAVSAATVAAGRLHPPRVLQASPAAAPGPVLPQAGVLQDLTRRVVTSGTGTALARVPGGPVGGKTGTAEYGSDVPPRTHAWFAGYQGDVAFAVLVEGGGFGGAVAAPVAADFLTRLAAG